jgi:hypothetical protein
MKRHVSFFPCENVQSLTIKMIKTDKHLVLSLVYKLIELPLILPVSTASVERAFSAMKIIKFKLRNKINGRYSSHLMMLILYEHSPQQRVGMGVYLVVLFNIILLICYISSLLFQIVLLYKAVRIEILPWFFLSR